MAKGCGAERLASRKPMCARASALSHRRPAVTSPWGCIRLSCSSVGFPRAGHQPWRAMFTIGTGTTREDALRILPLVPAQHAQGTQGVPPARPALALVDLDRHHAGITGLERPTPVGITLRGDQLDGFSDPCVGLDAGGAQVLEATQHVVVPPGREGKARPQGTALAIP